MVRSTGFAAWLVVAGAVALATDAFAERKPYDRYQSIVDRQMFGPLPAGFDPSKSPAEVSKSGSAAAEKELTKEQEKVKSAIRFSVINVTPQGETAIGFTDNSDPKAPVHYYLKVGESRGGWVVKEADAKAATMTIAKDGVEVSLSLGGDSAKDGKTQAASADAASKRRSPMLTTLGSRRRARQEREEADQLAAAKREEERKAREEERARRDEEEKALREAEREEQRRQLQQIQEELRKAREERQAQEREKGSKDGEEAQSDAE